MSEDNKELKAYITKLNDRNIQRQRESGLTEYAILGIIGFFCFKIIEDAKFFLLYNQYKNEILIVFMTIGTIISLIITYESIKNILYSQRLQIAPALDTIDSSTDALIEFFIWFVYLSIGFLCFNLFNKNSEIAYQLKSILAIFIFHVSIFLIAFLMFLNQNMVKINRVMYPVKKILKVIGSIFLLAISFFLIKNISEIYFKLDLNEKILVEPIKLGINIYLLSHFILLYRKHKLEKNKYFWLEKLEIDMQLGNIDNNEIIDLLEINYFGTDFSKWMEHNNKYINQIEQQLANEFIIVNESYIKIRRGYYNDYSEREKESRDLIKKIQYIIKNFNYQTKRTRLRIDSVNLSTKLSPKESYFVDQFRESISNIDTKYISKLEEFKDLISEDD